MTTQPGTTSDDILTSIGTAQFWNELQKWPREAKKWMRLKTLAQTIGLQSIHRASQQTAREQRRHTDWLYAQVGHTPTEGPTMPEDDENINLGDIHVNYAPTDNPPGQPQPRPAGGGPWAILGTAIAATVLGGGLGAFLANQMGDRPDRDTDTRYEMRLADPNEVVIQP